MSKKVLLAFSGGVDSSIAAYKLKEQGYDVTACFMRNWDSIANNDIKGNSTLNGSKCSQEIDYDYAIKAAQILGIPLIRKDFIEEYWDEVFLAFLDSLKKGLTPNPDVFCNRYVKFGKFLEYANSLGYDTIAMGHYAKNGLIDNVKCLLMPLDKEKDQTYFLCLTNKKELDACLFPLDNITKVEVRDIAKKLNLPNATKHGSTGVCFIGERNFRPFLENYINPKPGRIVDAVSAKIIGEHEGAYFYTIGQHKGLNIGGQKGMTSNPFFVVGKNMDKNIIYVAQEEGNDIRFSYSTTLSHFNWIGPKPIEQYLDCECKFRYRSKPLPVRISIEENDKIRLIFPTGYPYIAPGQIACLYKNDICLGGGVMEETFTKDGKKKF